MTCPRCHGEMVARTQRATGKTFWGCLGFPTCRGTRPGVKDRPSRRQERLHWSAVKERIIREMRMREEGA